MGTDPPNSIPLTDAPGSTATRDQSGDGFLTGSWPASDSVPDGSARQFAHIWLGTGAPHEPTVFSKMVARATSLRDRLARVIDVIDVNHAPAGQSQPPSSPAKRRAYLAIVYSGALVAQGLAAIISLELAILVPRLEFRGAIFLLVTAATALTFDVAPGLFAALCGAALMDFVLFTPRFTFLARSPGDLASVLLYLLVGMVIALCAGQAPRLRRAADRAQAETVQARMEAIGRAEQLQSTFDAITDGVLLYDTNMRLIRHNQALEQMLRFDLAHDQSPLTALPPARDAWGDSLAPERMPQRRALAGESLTGAQSLDVRMSAYDGRELEINVSAAPVRDAHNHIIGSVAIYRELTERRQREESAQKALSALIEMAQTLVATTPDTPPPPDVSPTEGAPTPSGAPAAMRPRVSFSQTAVAVRQIARRLAAQTQSVLGGSRVTLTAVDPEQELIQPLAVSGMAQDQEDHLWASWPEHVRLADLMSAEDITRLREGGILTGDRGQLRADDPRDPYNTRSALVAPGILRGKLICLLTVDHGPNQHIYSTQERALASAVTQLIALVIERERLARERAQALAREVTLLATREQMDRFLTLASHELRTPLTTMKMSIQMVAKRMGRLLSAQPTPSGPTPFQSALERIGRFGKRRQPEQPWIRVPVADAESVSRLLRRAEEAVVRQERLVNDLLDVSRIQWDKLHQHIAPTDLGALAQDAVEEQRLANAERKITLIAPEAPISVLADSDRIRQALANYLINALRYSPVERPVTVTLSRDTNANLARVIVRDEGPGIPPGELQYIWERFYRAPGVNHSHGSHVGLGLGLFISREIIQRHGGQVGVRNIVGSDGAGQGAEFWFTLPLASDEAAEAVKDAE